ncbi:MAG: alpha/beta fold hydrolase [Actinomycetota bacterium]
MADVLPGAEPFSAAGGPCGALVLHGFTGSPQSMRPLARAFADAGYTVELPLLPGHGTTVQDMADTGWADWTAAVDRAYQQLASRCDAVVVAGLSMGGSLALWLAAEHPEITGLILVNPVAESDDFGPLITAATQLLDAGEEFMPGVGNDVADPDVTELAYTSTPVRCLLSLVDGITAQKERLASITAPTLLLHSLQDHIVPPSSAALLAERLAGPVEVVDLERSFHVATIDLDQDVIAARAVAFAGKVTGIR